MFESFLKNLDLAITVLFVLLSIPFALVPPLNETLVRVVISLPVVLFLPGYSLIVTLFPRRDDLGGMERVALSFGLSIAVVTLLCLVLNYTPLGIALITILTSISTFTISLSLVAWVRRMNLPTEQRFRVPFERLLKVKSLFASQSVKDKVLSIILVISIIALSATLVYVVVTPKTGERFTEFYILGQNRIASDYPTDLKVGEEGNVIIGIVNHECENFTYRLEVNFNGFRIHEEHVFLIENEKWERPFTFKAIEKGENQRLEFLLYKDQQIEAYRTLHIWINVT